MSAKNQPLFSPRATTPKHVKRVFQDHIGQGLSASEIRSLCEKRFSRKSIHDSLKKFKEAGVVESKKSPTDGRKTLYIAKESIKDVNADPSYGVKFYVNNGYRAVHHHHDCEKLSFPIHRLVAVAEYGYDAVCGSHIHHKNKHRIDNRPKNLVPLEEEKHSAVESIASSLLRLEPEQRDEALEIAREVHAEE